MRMSASAGSVTNFTVPVAAGAGAGGAATLGAGCAVASSAIGATGTSSRIVQT